MTDPSNRLHRGRSGRSFNRSNSRNRSTSRAPPCHRTTLSDQRGGSGGHQPMNVALPNGQRPNQTKAKAEVDMQGRPAAPGSKPKNFARGETSESQRLRALCALPALWEQIEWEKPYWYNEIKRPKKKNERKKINMKGGNVRELGAVVLSVIKGKTVNGMSPCITLSL